MCVCMHVQSAERVRSEQERGVLAEGLVVNQILEAHNRAYS